MRRHLKKYYWLIWLIPLMLMILVFNSKAYILVFLLFGMTLFLFGQNLFQTLFYMLILSIPFERVIRGWWLTVVPFDSQAWVYGYEFSFGISLKLIFSATLFLLILLRRNDFKVKFTSNIYILSLIGFFIFACISSFFAFRYDLMITGLIRLWMSVWIFFISRYYFSKRDIRLSFPKYLVSCLLFFGLIGTLQFIKRQPLGLDMEIESSKALFGFLTSDGEENYRVQGFMGHPTYFGSFMSLIFPVGLGMLVGEMFKKKKVFLVQLISSIALLLGFSAIFGSFSRTAWFSLLIILVLFLKKIRQTIRFERLKLKKDTKMFLIGGLIVVIGIVCYGSLILFRAHSLKYMWTLGSGRGRLPLMKHSLVMIKNNPILGAGFNHFTSEMIDQGVEDKHRAFIYPVHNTFLLFFSELGIPAGVLFIIFLMTTLFYSRRKINKDWIDYGIWIGVITFIINAQFHTLFSQDPTFDLLMVMLAYLSVDL